MFSYILIGYPSSELYLKAQTVRVLALGHQHTFCGLKFINSHSLHR